MIDNNTIEYKLEISDNDEKLVDYLDIDTGTVDEVPVTIKYEIDFDGTNSRYERHTDYNIYSILTPYKGKMVEIIDVLDKRNVQWLEELIADGSIN